MPENNNRELEKRVNEKFNRIREEVAKELGVFPEAKATSGYNFAREEKE
ncbi:hypothetical protein [Bacillus sp. FJAT-27225]|nr:hypothetical protein [Bacillus sp. FJAT-27225]